MDLMGTNHNSQYIKKNWSSKCSQMFFLSFNVTTPYYHWVLYLIKIIIGRCISPYSLIMDCCKYFCTLKKHCSIMTIQKLFKKFIQCDYIIYNIVVHWVLGSKHGWGTQKDRLILYSLDPPQLNMLKFNDTFILKVWFYS